MVIFQQMLSIHEVVFLRNHNLSNIDQGPIKKTARAYRILLNINKGLDNNIIVLQMSLNHYNHTLIFIQNLFNILCGK